MVLENSNLPSIATMPRMEIAVIKMTRLFWMQKTTPLMSIGAMGGECLRMQNGQNCEVIAVGQQ